MALKIAAADQTWLQNAVLTERRRLAGLHKAALLQANTQTAIQDHEEDPGYMQAIAEEKKAPQANKTSSIKSAIFTTPDALGVNEGNLSALNEAQEELENMDPTKDPKAVADLLHSVWQPQMTKEQLLQAAQAGQGMRPMAASVKTAEDEEGGEEHMASKKKAAELKYDESGEPPNTEKATKDHDFELKALAKQIQGFTGGKTEWDPNDPLKD